MYNVLLNKISCKYELSIFFYISCEMETICAMLVSTIPSDVEKFGGNGNERAPVIQALQSLRGVAKVIATSLVAEVGEFRRFRNPKQLMAYAGVVPSEHSSGASRKQGSITKTGNAHLRRVLGEAAWCYRYKPAIKGKIRKRQEGQSPQIQDIAWRAQDRLHRNLEANITMSRLLRWHGNCWDSYGPLHVKQRSRWSRQPQYSF
jgi:Transposase IS116/IS110/IS902 family